MRLERAPCAPPIDAAALGAGAPLGEQVVRALGHHLHAVQLPEGRHALRLHHRRLPAARRRRVPGLRAPDARAAAAAGHPLPLRQRLSARGAQRRETSQSHAWIEFFSPSRGWVPFDPTHDRAVDERYVVVGHGRHYDDVPPNKGIFRGSAERDAAGRGPHAARPRPRCARSSPTRRGRSRCRPSARRRLAGRPRPPCRSRTSNSSNSSSSDGAAHRRRVGARARSRAPPRGRATTARRTGPRRRRPRPVSPASRVGRRRSTSCSRPDEFSALHRLRSDELWHFHAGAPLGVVELTPAGARCVEHRLGLDVAAGERPQLVIPAGSWFGARVVGNGRFTLAGCTVAPGFDFADFELGGAGGAGDAVSRRRGRDHDADPPAAPWWKSVSDDLQGGGGGGFA